MAETSQAEPSEADGEPGSLALAIGLAAAATGFTATFRGPRERFWDRMTLTGVALALIALATSRKARGARIRFWHVPVGLASAGILYATFQIGDRFARRFVPSGDAQIREIYALRALRPRTEIATRLAAIIGPAEELFWRGLIQAALMRRFGRWKGAALAAGAYGGVHVTSGNFTRVFWQDPDEARRARERSLITNLFAF